MDENKFREVLERAAGKVAKKKEKKGLFIKRRNLTLDQADILYIESRAKKAEIHTARSKDIIEIYATMEELEETVLSALKELIGQLLDADEVIRQAGERQNRRIDIQKMEERIQANEEEINRYNRMLVSLYEDYKEGIVDKKDFQLIKENFEQKKTIAEQAIRNIEKEAETAEQQRDSDRSWIEEYRENRNISSLTRSLVVNLIREVMVHEKGNLEVVLDCDDKFHSMLEQAARIRKAEQAERMAV